MNQFVPDFDMEDDNSIPPPSSGSLRQKNMQEDDILELLWQNGQVVVQSRNPRLHNKSSPPPTTCMHHNQQEPEIHQPPPSQPPTMPCDATTHLIMQEEEIISWLQYPLVDSSFDRDLNELFYPPPGPPLPPADQVPFCPEPPGTDINVPHFSGTTTIFPESAPSTSSRNNELRESMVDSCDTPAIRQKSKIPIMTRNAIERADRGHRLRESFTGVGGSEIGGTSMAGGGGGASTSFSKDIDTCDLPLTSSPGCSAACASFSTTATGDLMVLPPGEDRKRKGREQVDEANTELQSQDVDIESVEPMKQTRGATIKRSRAAEVHNLSERKRRDRINEKMRVLQDLIPQSTKTDKASMLDEAIDYMKSLQMQIQMMSMGCGMVPVMFPGVQQYMSSMGLGMGMEMGMTRPMMQFPGGVSGQSMPTLGAPSHMHPRFPCQAFQMPHISGTDPSRIQQATNPQYAFQQMQMQMPIPQNQPNPQPSSSKPSTSRASKDKGKENPATG